MIHHLQQNIEQIRMRFFYFVQKQHSMRGLVNRIRQQPALIKTNIAWGRANQPRHRMALHIFGHIKPHEFDAQRLGQLFCNFRFTNARRAGKQIVANWFFSVTQASPGQFNRRCQRRYRLILAKYHPFQIIFQ